MTNLVDIAATIRKHSPGVLPESVVIVAGTILAMRHTPVRETSGGISYSVVMFPDDIAEAVLRDAMTSDVAPHAILIRTSDAYRLDAMDGKRERWFHDSDHGGSLGACYAAWRWSKGIACDTHPSA